jgi:hypothetical protein
MFSLMLPVIKTYSTVKKTQASAHLMGAVARRPVNARIVKNVILIWLMASKTGNDSTGCQTPVNQLRRLSIPSLTIRYV